MVYCMENKIRLEESDLEHLFLLSHNNIYGMAIVGRDMKIRVNAGLIL